MTELTTNRPDAAGAARPEDAGQQSDTDDYKVEIKCPWSNHMVLINIPPKKSADEFCPYCDFPIFWSYRTQREVRARQAELAEQAQRDRELKQQQPVAAPPPPPPLERDPTFSCRGCSKVNPLTSRFCSACGLDAHRSATAVRVRESTLWIAALIVIAALLVVLAVYGPWV